MKKWNFNNGITVEEKEYDRELHCFAVFSKAKYLGDVYPETIEDMESCVEDLDEGNDPISAGWEDGLGHPCTFDGWNEE